MRLASSVVGVVRGGWVASLATVSPVAVSATQLSVGIDHVDGAAPFNSVDTAGYDSGPANDIVRTNDTIVYRVSVSAAEDPRHPPRPSGTSRSTARRSCRTAREHSLRQVGDGPEVQRCGAGGAVVLRGRLPAHALHPRRRARRRPHDRRQLQLPARRRPADHLGHQRPGQQHHHEPALRWLPQRHPGRPVRHSGN